ncbi:MAG: hypothetical protein WCV90_07355 [Candidatus Woesearchaeota archaeon]|jgi:hypothetical protein
MNKKFDSLKSELKKLNSKDRKLISWVMREFEEVKDLAQDVGHLLILHQTSGKNLKSVAVAEKGLLGKVTHEGRTVARFERRVNRFCNQLDTALTNLIGVEKELGEKEKARVWEEEKKKVEVYQRNLIKRLSLTGSLKTLLNTKPVVWSNVNGEAEASLTDLQALVTLCNELEKMEEGQFSILVHQERMEEENFKADLQIAKKISEGINSAFYEGERMIDPKRLFGDIQLAKINEIGSGDYLGHIKYDSKLTVFVDGFYLVASEIVINFIIRTVNFLYSFPYYSHEMRSFPSQIIPEDNYRLARTKVNLFGLAIGRHCGQLKLINSFSDYFPDSDAHKFASQVYVLSEKRYGLKKGAPWTLFLKQYGPAGDRDQEYKYWKACHDLIAKKIAAKLG